MFVFVDKNVASWNIGEPTLGLSQ